MIVCPVICLILWIGYNEIVYLFEMKTIFGILLSFIVLFSQTGFVYQAHFCGNEIVDEHIGITFNDISCGMSKEVQNDCSSHENKRGHTTVKEGPCCKDVVSYKKHNVKRSFDQVNINTALKHIPIKRYSSTLVESFYSFKVPVQLKSNPPPNSRCKNLSNQLSQAKYLAFIQSYLC